MRKNLGFTLIELLVVVLIIGILAAVALPEYEKAVEKTRVSEAILQFNSMEKAISRRFLSEGTDWMRSRVEGLAVFNELDLDFSSSMFTESGSRYMCSSNFMYDVDCTPYHNRCILKAIRLSGRNKPNKCKNVAMQDAKYWLVKEVFPDGRLTKTFCSQSGSVAWATDNKYCRTLTGLLDYSS